MTWLKAFYDSSPLLVQRTLVHAEGARTFFQKYGGTFRSTLARLKMNEAMTSSELRRLQQDRLASLLSFAKENVPYYRRLSPDPGQLESWPILDKQSVVAAGRDLLAERPRSDRLRELHTSGTTGTPLTVWADTVAYQTEMAFRWRHRAW